jgi:hypothetical protein
MSSTCSASGCFNVASSSVLSMRRSLVADGRKIPSQVKHSSARIVVAVVVMSFVIKAGFALSARFGTWCDNAADFVTKRTLSRV